MFTRKDLTSTQFTRDYASKKLAPAIEEVEKRRLLATGFGVIAGTAFVDVNSNDTLGGNDPYLPGATIQLFRVGTTNPVATQITNAYGSYAFTGLAPGSYIVSEIPPSNAKVTGTQVLSQVEPATSLIGNRIQVAVPSNPLFLNYSGVLPGYYQVSNNVVNGNPTTDSEGQLQISLGTSKGATDVNPGFLSYCLDDLHRLTFGGGEKYQIVTKPITSATNGTSPISTDHAGRIAFLYNHFSNTSLNNIQGPALQLAIWELLYDTGPVSDYAAGNFQVTGPDEPFTDSATLNQVLQQASAYYNMSNGKSETALLLDSTPFDPPGTDTGSQSMIAQGSFNFANMTVAPPLTSSLGGTVYCDVSNTDSRVPGDPGISGVVLALTGTDVSGNVVKLTTASDARGSYQFTNLNPGVYTITLLSAPPGFVPARDSQGSPGTGVVQVNRILNISVPGGVIGTENNFGLKGQAVSQTKLELIGIHQQQSQIILHFNGPLDPAAAHNPANYSLIGLGKDEMYGTRDDIKYSVISAVYQPGTAIVTLTPNTHLNIHYHYVLQYSLPGVNSCAPFVASTSVFGRSAVPFYDIHGGLVANQPLNPQEARHDAQVVARTLSKLGKNSKG